MATVFTAAITASADDGQFDGSSLTSNGAGITIGGVVSQTNGYFRFQNVTVPNSAIITAATLTLKSVALSSAVNATVRGALVADAANPATGAAATAEARTVASVAWALPLSVPGATAVSPSIKSVIQELVNQADWVSGNDILLYVDWVSTAAIWACETKDTGGGTVPSLSISLNPTTLTSNTKRGRL